MAHPAGAAGSTLFADVILPLALNRAYTYRVPEELVAAMQPGIRVEVQFGSRRLYAALVKRLHYDTPQHRAKPILNVIDDSPVLDEVHFRFWDWLANYYCCTIGEVMNAALPANLKLSSETTVTLGPLFHQDPDQLDEKEYLVAEALSLQSVLSIEDIQGILGIKTVFPIIKRLLDKRIIYLEEELKERYQPKQVRCVRWAEPYASDPGLLNDAFQLTARSEKQEAVLLAFVQVVRQQDFVRQTDLLKLTSTDASVIKALEKKGILECYHREVSRLGNYEENTVDADALSGQQADALRQIRAHFQEKDIVLLHGVTGSGKTRVYLELLQEAIARGEQVLFLLPEIALTTQIIQRVQKVLGDDVAVYHSRLNHNERVELWRKVQQGHSAVLGPRSALFLPFQKLSLVIIDEEHDPSYKQRDPNPRYQGRDAALVLARMFQAKTVLGSATPSVESFHLAQTGKYGLVAMPERFGGMAMPELKIIDLRLANKQQTLHNHFTEELLEALRTALQRNEQAILFQNRRGYAPIYRCPSCGWHAECVNCDVSLTFHKFREQLKCHYCGYTTKPQTECPACGSLQLLLQGMGTEKIEDELRIFLPEAEIGRLDLDTAKGKNAFSKIIGEFEEGEIEILVGTQMVTKGLDFERVAVVGIPHADQLLQYPDYRSAERAFQLMLQVAGRAGRKHRQGLVLVQTFSPEHPVMQEVAAGDYAAFFRREISERQRFGYPPFCRMIAITLKHKQPQTVHEAMQVFAAWLKKELGDWVIGPSIPSVARLNGYYLEDLLLKIDRDPQKLAFAKRILFKASQLITQQQGYSALRVVIDVDP